MTTRASQFEILSAGVLYQGVPIDEGYVKFFSAGTTTAKNAWADVAKASSFTKKQLDAYGRAVAYGDGVYKLCFYEGDPDVTGEDPVITLDNIKCYSPLGDITIITSSHTITPDDELAVIDASGGAITISFQTVANFTKPVDFIIKDSTYAITFDPYSNETVNGSTTLTSREKYGLIKFVPDTTNTLWLAHDSRAPQSVVSLTATTTLTNYHSGKILKLSASSAVTMTLPAATGTGDAFKFVVGAVNTSGYLIKVSNSSHTIDGQVITLQDGGDTLVAFETASDSDTITLNGTTTGGASIGNYVELIDIASNQWAVNGQLTGTGSEATPFSATV